MTTPLDPAAPPTLAAVLRNAARTLASAGVPAPEVAAAA